MFLSGRECRALLGRLDKIDSAINELRELQRTIMAKIDDLNAAVQAEEVELTHLTDAVSGEETRVTAAIDALKAATGGTPDATLDPVIASLQAHVTNLQAINAGLTAFDATS
jgi:predicted  nucleic acid-binding Zn-ribbon protein